MKHGHWKTVGTLCVTLIAAMPAVADVKDGVDAWTRGDFAAAVAQWRGPAERGDADAQFNLGQAYKLGRGVPRDLTIAQSWYHKAAVQGHREAQDNYGLALFENGDPTAAMPWLKQSADRGEPRAQYVLGTIYFNGEYVEKDWVRAYALMSRAAAAGLPQASKTLTEMGRYVSLDDRQKGLKLARDYEKQAIASEREASAIAGRGEDTTPAAPPPGTVAQTDLPPSNAYGYGSLTPRQPDATPPRAQAAPPPRSKPEPGPQPEAKPAARPAPVSTPVSGGWAVQLGAFGEPGNAPRLWQQVKSRFPARDVHYAKAGRLTKVIVGPYASRAEAQAACAKVTPCIPVRN
ncbi:SEL1-like repeat protein [Stakelama sp. CBK3Z-3]|uniref:SEL1-like repeat protein n=1 Tax=Stakelama flava TaxID=2860338 RepID=A0ABS6XH96_9SPHN|nr:SPOR domain-containing protein [Stakelama flava]MBW4329589.1 SEL1-like repeat protein [Stakelama flava]